MAYFRPLRLGVLFDQQIHAGGAYQQALNAAMVALELPPELVKVVFFTTLPENVSTLSTYGIESNVLRLSWFAKIRSYFRRLIISTRLFRLVEIIEPFSPFEANFVNYQIDLVYLLSPTSWAQSLEKLNYIVTLWDLCHRDDPEFPEVRSSKQFESRDRNYRAILPRATAIFVDSELGKNNAVHRYGLDQARIHVMPFQPAEASRRKIESDLHVRDKYQLEFPYVFYPAQFWPHKNHIYLLEGLRSLEERFNKFVGVIFAGGDKGNRPYVERYARNLGLLDRVRFAGFVSNDEIVALYRQSVALVMPSYFGPTNLPPLEAFELGIPVLYSDKSGLRDQVGEAALLMDLDNPESMAVHLNNLIEDEYLSSRLIAAGYDRLKHFESHDRISVLRNVIKDFYWRRLCWE
jgi:glycosyltransferase involved in cell wall biosynthesis